MRARRKMGVMALALVAVEALNGCATMALWGDGAEEFRFPAPKSGIELFDASAKADVLVEYDELVPNKGTSRRRAYYLMENASRIHTDKKPRFVPLSTAEGLDEIPLYLEAES